jgi:cytochrome c-type biogenesis protein CcmH/NrfF
MIESVKALFYPAYMARKQKIKLIREKDRQLSEKLAKQFEELDQALECNKCTKQSQ